MISSRWGLGDVLTAPGDFKWAAPDFEGTLLGEGLAALSRRLGRPTGGSRIDCVESANRDRARARMRGVAALSLSDGATNVLAFKAFRGINKRSCRLGWVASRFASSPSRNPHRPTRNLFHGALSAVRAGSPGTAAPCAQSSNRGSGSGVRGQFAFQGTK